MFDVIVDFPRMKVAVATRDARVVEIRYLPLFSKSISPKNALAARAAEQLEAYLANPDARFDLPLALEGTPFQLKLWEALCRIPRGKTLTYGELARRLDGEAARSARPAATTGCRSSFPATASSPPTASAASRTRPAATCWRRSVGCSRTSWARTRSS